MTDLVGFGEATIRLRAESGRRLGDSDSFTAGVGGPERNAIVTAAGLGADAVWLSRLPDSPLGERVVADLRQHGVRTGVSKATDGGIATAFVESGPAPRGRTVVHNRSGAAFETVDAATLPMGVVQDAARFHVTGATLARSEGAKAATESLLEAASETATTTSFDLRYRERDWSRETARAACTSIFPHVDVLFVALSETQAVFGEEGDPVEVAHSLRTDHGFETVVLTREGGSALAVHGDEVHKSEAVPGETVDEAGAADAFVGAFHAKRTAGGGIGDALAWGGAAAALARTLSGETVSVSPAEVKRVVGAGPE